MPFFQSRVAYCAGAALGTPQASFSPEMRDLQDCPTLTGQFLPQHSPGGPPIRAGGVGNLEHPTSPWSSLGTGNTPRKLELWTCQAPRIPQLEDSWELGGHPGTAL
ncbi:Hypothetical predicted protein, partial [Marmota monax]